MVVVAGEEHPVAAVELAEALATSDFPPGSVNVLTGSADELAPWLAGHMDVNAIDLTGISGDTAELQRSAAENVKRVVRGQANKVIAMDLGVSQRTVELHRARVMKKLKLRSVAELVHAVDRIGGVGAGRSEAT